LTWYEEAMCYKHGFHMSRLVVGDKSFVRVYVGEMISTKIIKTFGAYHFICSLHYFFNTGITHLSVFKIKPLEKLLNFFEV